MSLFIFDNPISYLSCSSQRSSVTTGGNWSVWRKPVMLGRVKLDNTLLTCDWGNYNHITAWSWNWTQVTMVSNALPLCHQYPKFLLRHSRLIKKASDIDEQAAINFKTSIPRQRFHQVFLCTSSFSGTANDLIGCKWFNWICFISIFYVM